MNPDTCMHTHRDTHSRVFDQDSRCITIVPSPWSSNALHLHRGPPQQETIIGMSTSQQETRLVLDPTPTQPKNAHARATHNHLHTVTTCMPQYTTPQRGSCFAAGNTRESLFPFRVPTYHYIILIPPSHACVCLYAHMHAAMRHTHVRVNEYIQDPSAHTHHHSMPFNGVTPLTGCLCLCLCLMRHTGGRDIVAATGGVTDGGIVEGVQVQVGEPQDTAVWGGGGGGVLQAH